MAIVYDEAMPKLLSAFTLDSNLTLRIKVTSSSQFDTNVDCTIAAGTYFLAWDHQDDDFFKALHDGCYTALVASGVSNYNGTSGDGKPIFYMTSNNRVAVQAGDEIEMSIDWTSQDGPTIAGILGFDSSAATELSNPFSATAINAPAYAWFAAERGQLADHGLVDSEEDTVLQSVAIGGKTRTQYLGSRSTNLISLQWLEEELVHSNRKGYTDSPVAPWVLNKPLECWWRQVRDGTRFRFYRSSAIDTSLAEVRGVATGGSATTLADTGKSFATNPQEHAGKLLYRDDFYNDAPMRWYISSHTATTLTLPNDVHNSAAGPGQYYICNQRYNTYVIDRSRMRGWEPDEFQPQFGRYRIDIPVRKYIG